VRARPASAVSTWRRRDLGLPATRTRPAARLRRRGLRRLYSSALRLVTASALVAGLLTLAPVAQGQRAVQGRSSVSLSLNVTFNANGTIAVTLPDGTPVGSTSGAPTLIPAGYYTLMLTGPGGCTQVPYFELRGPGTTVRDNMTEGETSSSTVNAYFLPNTTYTWRNATIPSVVYTFVTSSDVQGTPPVHAGSSGLASDKHSTASSQDVVGSTLVPFRGTLTGGVSAAGKLTLAYKGRSVTSLTVGRYTIAVTDRSATNGFVVQKLKHPAVSVTGVAFVGKRSASVALTAGQWSFTPRPGKTTYSIVVRAKPRSPAS
jgi:hypothetical protein